MVKTLLDMDDLDLDQDYFPIMGEDALSETEKRRTTIAFLLDEVVGDSLDVGYNPNKEYSDDFVSLLDELGKEIPRSRYLSDIEGDVMSSNYDLNVFKREAASSAFRDFDYGELELMVEEAMF